MLMNFLSRIFTNLIEVIAWIILAIVFIGGIVFGSGDGGFLGTIVVWLIGLLLIVIGFGSFALFVKLTKDVSGIFEQQKEIIDLLCKTKSADC